VEQITQLLVKWGDGDRTALDKLMPLLYDELHKLAAAYLRRERNHHSLQPTALINEMYMRLIEQKSGRWQNRAQFFGLTAKLMRNILVDHARQQQAAKRGGPHYCLSLSKADRIGSKPEVEMLALDEALTDLARTHPEHSRVVELRFFGGLTIEETAAALGLSHATVEREWSFARAWLRRALRT
jgi:RNA polymerase sigma-70 factor, ECF subfamily